MVELCMSGQALSIARRSLRAHTMNAFIGRFTCTAPAAAPAPAPTPHSRPGRRRRRAPTGGTDTAAVFTDIAVYEHTHTHTHIPFNGLLSGTARVSRYQKGKTDLDFTEARDSEWQWHQLGHMQVCISLQTDNHASTPPLSFLQAGCPSCRPTNSVKALNTQGEITSQNLRSRYARHFVGITWLNVWSKWVKIYHVIQIKFS